METPPPAKDTLRSLIRLVMGLLKPGTWVTVTVRIEDGKIRLVSQLQSWTPDKLPG